MNSASAVPYSTPGADRLALALFIATALHALLILGISFDMFTPSSDDSPLPTLDITVVTTPPTKAVENADYLAATSQEGAGNTEEKVQPRQQAVEQAPPPTPAAANPPAPTPTLSAKLAREKTPKPAPKQDPKPEPVNAEELINRSMEMLALNREINQNLRVYSKAPKSKFISARTKEFKYANYMRDWVAKVERVGDLNYPDAARRRNLSGKLIVQVAIYPDGSVREITIRKPSGHKILDDAAVRIVKLAAPFAPFPEDIKKDTDIMYITRTWVFTSGNRLQSN